MDMWRGMLRALAMFIVVRKFSICKDFPERQEGICGEVCCMHYVVRKFSICKNFRETGDGYMERYDACTML